MIQCSQVGVFIAFNMSVLSQLCQRIYTPPPQKLYVQTKKLFYYLYRKAKGQA